MGWCALQVVILCAGQEEGPCGPHQTLLSRSLRERRKAAHRPWDLGPPPWRPARFYTSPVSSPSRRCSREGTQSSLRRAWQPWGFPGDLAVKNLPAMQEPQETQVQPLGWEDPLEKEMATHSSILARDIPRTEESGGLQSIEWQRVGHDKGFSTHAGQGTLRRPPVSNRKPDRWNGPPSQGLQAMSLTTKPSHPRAPPWPDRGHALFSHPPNYSHNHSQEAHREPRVLKPPHKVSVLKSRTSSNGRQSDADEWIVAKWKVLFKKYDFLQLGFLPNVPNVEIALQDNQSASESVLGSGCQGRAREESQRDVRRRAQADARSKQQQIV